jgi:hypothetical protein
MSGQHNFTAPSYQIFVPPVQYPPRSSISFNSECGVDAYLPHDLGQFLANHYGLSNRLDFGNRIVYSDPSWEYILIFCPTWQGVDEIDNHRLPSNEFAHSQPNTADVYEITPDLLLNQPFSLLPQFNQLPIHHQMVLRSTPLPRVDSPSPVSTPGAFFTPIGESPSVSAGLEFQPSPISVGGVVTPCSDGTDQSETFAANQHQVTNTPNRKRPAESLGDKDENIPKSCYECFRNKTKVPNTK